MTDGAPGRELVRAALPPAALSKSEHTDLARVANTLAASGFFPDAKGGTQAYAKILLGRSIGLSPMESMTGIHVVEGKPQIAATTLASFVKRSPLYDYRVLRHTDEECLIEFGLGEAPRGRATVDVDEESGTISVDPEWPSSLGVSGFTVDEAKTAGLGKWPDEAKWGKSQWGKWPRNMVFARAMSNGVKWYCPDLFGGVPVYTEADEFERGAASGDALDATAQGLDLGPEVEAVIARAGEVGHAALANRAAIEVALDGQTPEFVKAWAESANRQLDAEPRPTANTDVEVDEEVELTEADALPAEDDAQGWRQRSAEKLAEWEALEREIVEESEGGVQASKQGEKVARSARLKHEADTALQTALGIEESGGVQAEVRRVEDGEGDES